MLELEHKKLTRARYKYAVRFVGKHEESLRAHSMAGNLIGNNVTEFWKEVKVTNRAKRIALPLRGIWCRKYSRSVEAAQCNSVQLH